MKKLLTILMLALVLALFATTAFASNPAHRTPPTLEFILSECVQGDLYSTLTLNAFDESVWESAVWLEDGTGSIMHDHNPYRYISGWRWIIPIFDVNTYDTEYYSPDGFYGGTFSWWGFFFLEHESFVFETCDWFVDHFNLIIPNMILYQGIEDPTMVLPIMTFGDTHVSQELQLAYSGFVGEAVCQAPVYEWIEEYGTVDMEGWWPCDEMMNELGGERFPLRCEAPEGEECDSLLNNFYLTSSWLVEP